MWPRLLDVLACPKCLGELNCTPSEVGEEGEINSGTLECGKCSQTYPIKSGIPRFISSDNYASSFGYQWNLFRAEQIDSINGLHHSEERFFSETKWDKEWMKGKWIMDAGCGAGRFMDVVSQTGAETVGLDISNAIDAAKVNLSGRKNVHFVQASIFELPFRTGAFDAGYCIGVIQHTPDPQRALRSLPRVLKEGGQLAVTIYERNRWTMLYSKYWVRPLTRRMNQKLLLGVVKGTMPVLFPITEVLFRIPVLGRYFMFAIPIANYVNIRELSLRQRYRWALLDTFDMLAPAHDHPQTQDEVETALKGAGIKEMKRTTPKLLSLTGQKG
jgi:ubiquinone/menaquinone biosynthesis C-methylase UbiE/uncharacterized protein YbaR (Trm112 family)